MDHIRNPDGSRTSSPGPQSQAGGDGYLIPTTVKKPRCDMRPAQSGKAKHKNELIQQAVNDSFRAGNCNANVWNDYGVESSDLGSVERGNGEISRQPLDIGGEVSAKLNAGMALRQSEYELQQLSARLLTVQEQERQRIAADLHDGIGQSLTLIKLSMESVVKLICSGEHLEAVEATQQMIRKVDNAVAELRRATSALHPVMLDDLGIVPAMACLCREFELVCRGTKIEKKLSIVESDVPARLKTTIYRILQEAINNAVKHANADRIHVRMEKTGDILLLSIADNGQGFDPAGISKRSDSSSGFGLLAMKERARFSNGNLEVKSHVGAGTRIQIAWRLEVHPAKHGKGLLSRARKG